MRDFGSPVGLAGNEWLLLKNGMCKKKMSKTGFDFMKVSNSYLDNNKKHLMCFFGVFLLLVSENSGTLISNTTFNMFAFNKKNLVSKH